MVPVRENIAELRTVKLQVKIYMLFAFVGVKRPAGKNDVSLLPTHCQALSARYKNAHNE